MKGPYFIGIGSHKGGTTWLAKNFREHPNIWIPPVKELDYFYRLQYGPRDNLSVLMNGGSFIGREWRKHVVNLLGRRYRKHPYPEALEWGLKYIFGHLGDEWYCSLFDPARGRICGEISTSYALVNEDVVAHAYRMLPDTKIIYLLRNPIRRAYSQIVMDFCHFQKRKLEDIKDDEIFDRLNLDDHIIRHCFYHANLNRWAKSFGREKIFIGFFEDIATRPVELLYELFEFVGAYTPSNYTPPFAHNRYNVSVVKKPNSKTPRRFATPIAKLIINDMELLAKEVGGPSASWLEEAMQYLD